MFVTVPGQCKLVIVIVIKEGKAMNARMKSLPLVAAFLGALLFVMTAHAQEAPDVLVKRITQEVMETAKTDKAIKAGNRKRIHELVETKIVPHVDLERATALAVGRHWRDASPQQREQLIKEFRALLLYTYAGGLSQIRDQKLEFKPLRADPADTEVEVRFEVRQQRRAEPVQVSYRLYKAPDGWKVYDVNVLGVWLGQTYRSSFAAEIERGGIDGLIDTLQEKNKVLASSPRAVEEERESLPLSR
jgi:phospholipid transport system substrate-binding protein